MIVSFYDRNFKGLQNNASLVVQKGTYKLIKRPIEMNSLQCVCEAFTEDIQPTFVVIQNNRGGYVYGGLAGIPLLNDKNQTEINGSDLKSIFLSDVILDLREKTFNDVQGYLTYIFDSWKSQVNQNSYQVELEFKEQGLIPLSDLKPLQEKNKYNAYEEMSKYLRFYNLYIDSKIDLVNKKIIFTIGQTMKNNINVKLWEYGIRNYGKWIANINEAQGFYNNNGLWESGFKWILTSQNKITKDESLRDIYPIKKKVVMSNESLLKANEDSLTELLNSLYNENINLNANEFLKDANFETNFSIYLKRGQEKYKDLPCGELEYNENGLNKIQIGFRYSGVEFI